MYDAVRRLNKIIELKGSQALCYICQRLNLPRHVAHADFITQMSTTAMCVQVSVN